MLKIEPPFREQKSSGMIRIPVADRLGQKSMERKKKRKKKRSLSLMNNDKQRHLVTTHVYIGVTWRWPLCQSLCLLSNRLENKEFIFLMAMWLEIRSQGLGEDMRVLKLLTIRVRIQSMFFGLLWGADFWMLWSSKKQQRTKTAFLGRDGKKHCHRPQEPH